MCTTSHAAEESRKGQGSRKVTCVLQFFFSLYIARSSGHTRQSQTTSQAGGPVQALTSHSVGRALRCVPTTLSLRYAPKDPIVSAHRSFPKPFAFAACMGYWRGFGWGVGGFGVA